MLPPFPLHKQYDVISYVCMPCVAVSAFVCWAQHFLLPNQFRTVRLRTSSVNVPRSTGCG